MKRVVPDYYERFQCIASRCRHSCCMGWEVDISPEALERYDRVEGDFGHRLRSKICREDQPHFLLEEGDRCPFLNEDNLCDIYIHLGEDALCQICADHPRWRNWFADRVEEGLGLCCEEVARLVLSQEAPTALEELEAEGDTLECGEEYLGLLESRQRLLAVLQNRAKPLQQRICEAKILSGISGEMPPFREDLDFLLGLEIMDGDWREALAGLEEAPWSEEWDGDGEQILCYLVYRYYLTWGLEQWAEEFALRLGLFSLRLLGALYARCPELTMEKRVELVRLWSAELEYSEENLERLADYLLGI